MCSGKPTIEPILYSDSARGVYIPQHFAESIRRELVTGVEPDDWDILSNPEHELYWDVWTGICDNATVTDDRGTRYRLYQDGDLWLVPEGMEWDDDLEFFKWPVEEISDDRDMTPPYEP